MPRNGRVDGDTDLASDIRLELAFAHFCKPLVLTEPDRRVP